MEQSDIHEMNPPGAVLVESVAQALTWAINDPTGHHSWKKSVRKNTVQTICKGYCWTEDAMQAVTVFDSSTIPPIGIQQYLKRLHRNFECSDATFIAALIVVDRTLEYNGVPLTMRNVHRIFFASLVVAVKYHEDLIFSNNHYARAGGVNLREVNRLERVLLMSLDFDLRIEPDQYWLYEATLLSLCSGSPKDFLNIAASKAPDAVVVEAPAKAQVSAQVPGAITAPALEKISAVVGGADDPNNGDEAPARKQGGLIPNSASTLRGEKSFGKQARPSGGQSDRKPKSSGK